MYLWIWIYNIMKNIYHKVLLVKQISCLSLFLNLDSYFCLTGSCKFLTTIFSSEQFPSLPCVCFCLKRLSLHCWWHITELTVSIIVTHAWMELKSYIGLDTEMHRSCFEFWKYFITHQHHAWTHVKHQDTINEMKQNGTKQTMKCTLI